MATDVYVGTTAAGLADGTSWANRYGTLNAAEDRPIVADTIVHVGPGVYRELLTCDVSGAAGQPIVYEGDTDGAETDGIGGIVRVTGSDNDQTATRAYCVNASAKDYRTFRGFSFDIASGASIRVTGGCDNWIIEDCAVQAAARGLWGDVFTGTNLLIRRCLFNQMSVTGIQLDGGSSANIENCVILVRGDTSNSGCIYLNAHNAAVIRNCTLGHGYRGVYSNNAAGAHTVNGCTIYSCTTGLIATVLGHIVENYNSIYICATARTNVGVGANSNTYPPLFDLGILHAGAGQASGFRMPPPNFGQLSQWSQVRAIADGGTNATLDLLGLTRPVTDGKRSWGAVQYPHMGRDTATVYAGSAALRFDDAGRRQFFMPCTAVATTVTVRCYREADYAGTAPTMVLKQPGQADRTTTDAGAAGAWNLLTDTFTPSATPGWFCVELVSGNTAAVAATDDCFFDSLTVSVNSTLGTMETWLWDTEVSDWVQNVPTGSGAVSISPVHSGGGMIG